MLEMIVQYGQTLLNLISACIDLLIKYHIHYGALLAAVTFAQTYTVKFFYKIAVKEKLTPNLIRGISILCGISSAYVAWPSASPMAWYVAGILAGPGSILVYDIMANTAGVKWPWFGNLLRGYRS